MRVPERLAALVDDGIVEDVVRPLMSGKEAQIYLVISEGEERVAKVYKEAQDRTFRHRAGYTEGRKTRNTRDQRAMNKRTRHGRARDEEEWRSTEVDIIHRLRDAGVRVPEPYAFVGGVLVMELIKDSSGLPAPRLGDLGFEPKEASEIYHQLIRETALMLCAGVVHADLSEFNVLMGAGGPALIDFPQAVDPAHNQNARSLLLRDVDNLHRFRSRFAPDERHRPYGEEMWKLYTSNDLTPETTLTGHWRAPAKPAATADVLALIHDANEEERGRRKARGHDDEPQVPPRRRIVDFAQEAKGDGAGRAKREGRARTGSRDVDERSGAARPNAPAKRGRRRRRKGGRSRADHAERPGASGDQRSSGSNSPAAEPRNSRAPGASGARGQGRKEQAPSATTGSSRPRRSRRRKPKPTDGARPSETESAAALRSEPAAAKPARKRRRRRSSSSGGGSSKRPPQADGKEDRTPRPRRPRPK